MNVKQLKLYASFFLIPLNETTLEALKISEAVGKKNLKGLKDKVCGLLRKTLIPFSISIFICH